MLFITSNEHKFKEVKEILGSFEIEVLHQKMNYSEIRADDVEEVALESAKTLFSIIKKPLVVEDTGLFIDVLKGFPGAYSGWVQKKLGNNGILKLMENESRRDAHFKTCVGYADEKGCRTFVGKVDGRISIEEQGKQGFGYDPIFIPNTENNTFAENETLKNRISHRFNAFAAFAKWYKA
ncbi:XTP/dITP diphosphatase [Candidatus Micrarchaeota archaeon]|nr:XTP/dITP diphosphatase [Candidatus Micrarchaeota archaeon]